MNFITVNEKNLDKEHICCAISDKKGEPCVSSKKDWMQARFPDGLVFQKLDVRGKVFIEYLPGENAWCPVSAENTFFINCFWVSGQYKGKGYANRLLDQCIQDAENQAKSGIAAVSSKSKKPFLSDPDYLKYKGFEVCDTSRPYFELLYYPLKKDAQKPQFRDCCRQGRIEQPGIVLYYSNQCPHTAKYVPLIAETAARRGVDFTLIQLKTKEQAQNAPVPLTTYSLFYNGEFITNEIYSEKKFIKFLDERGL
ncbi:GNAT family N-acetyltransferase [Sinanaerobacter chloroacetimidivorans]|uniref:YoaP domain-containing protein n=1 Tax=Sinanaerobacter chloroacetimidivorans TaxID=2818044 RepID=A0A8J8B2F5_9FIRM|nr:N-acetyltransferase [Sinanaerobacter chloroacetimidivorans]MBR0598672.1 YoaP domain-containing protein [Sinanaerobacter chloroacetimidivorans]